jgi:hypothetical protein
VDEYFSRVMDSSIYASGAFIIGSLPPDSVLLSQQSGGVSTNVNAPAV